MTDPTKRWATLFVGAIFLLVAPVGVLSYLYVSAKTDYFTARKFRLLAMQGEQLKAAIENIVQRRLPKAVTVTETDSTVTEYSPAGAQSPIQQKQIQAALFPLIQKRKTRQVEIDIGELELVGNVDVQRSNDPKQIHTVVQMEARQDGEKLRILFGYTGRTGQGGFSVSFHVSGQIQPFAEADHESVFDDLLLADEQGKVVFQKRGTTEFLGSHTRRVLLGSPPSEVEVLQLGDLIHQSGSDTEQRKVRKADEDEKTVASEQQPSHAFGAFSKLHTVVLAGREYKLFLYPVQISLYDSAAMLPQEPLALNWVVGGLIRSDRFHSESLTISYTMVLIFLFILLLVLLSWPFLKVWYLNPKRRLQTSDILALTLAVLMGHPVVSIFLFDLYSYERTGEALDQQLKSLAGEVSKNFRTELTQICALLEELRGQVPTKELRTITRPAELPQTDWELPLFERITWVNGNGMQTHKWTIKRLQTKPISVAQRGYFQNVQEGRTWTMEIPSCCKAAKSVPFWLEPVISWNTGENLAIISTPRKDAAGVLTMTVKLASLRGPILPPGFEFVVVEQNGNELFQSDSSHPRENLFEECDNDHGLRAAVSGRARELMNVSYLGRGHRFYVAPLEGLPWSLVVYRDKEPLRSTNLEILSVAVILYLLYGLIVLLPVTLSFFWKANPAWPDLHKVTSYGQLSVSYAFVTLFGLLAILFFQPYQVWYTMLCVSPFTLLLTHWKLASREQTSKWRKLARLGVLIFVLVSLLAWSNWHSEKLRPALVVLAMVIASLPVLFPLPEQLAKTLQKLSWRSTYLLALTLLLGVISLLPSLAFYSISYQTEIGRFVKHAQFELFRSLLARADRLTTEYREIQAPENFLPARLRTSLDIYQGFFFEMRHRKDLRECDSDCKARPVVRSDRACTAPENRFEWMLEMVRPLYNASNAATHQFTHEFSGDCSFQWILTNKSLAMREPLGPGATFPLIESHLLGWRWPNTVGWVILLIMIASACIYLVYVSAAFLARAVYLLNFEAPAPVDTNGPISTRRNLLLLGPPFAGKSKRLQDLDAAKFDVRTLSGESDWLKSMDLKNIPKEKVVVIDHLDYDMMNVETNLKKLNFLARLIEDNRTVAMSSTVDPLNFNFTDGNVKDARKRKEAAQNTLDRWANLMSVFSREHVSGAGDAVEFQSSLMQENLPKEVLKVLAAECSPTAYLQKRVGREMVVWVRLRSATPDQRVSPEQLVAEIEDRAHAYYRALWAASTKEEKLALLDAAEDDFLNSQNPAIHSLLRRGLLTKDPMLKLMNRSFRNFVMAQGQAENVAAWEETQTAGRWGTLRWLLSTVVIAVALVLFFTQRSVFDNIVLFLGTVGGGVAAFFNLLNMFRGRQSS